MGIGPIGRAMAWLTECVGADCAGAFFFRGVGYGICLSLKERPSCYQIAE